jgi:hypothetical protein
MILVTSNKAKQLLYLNYVGHVRPEDFERSHGEFLAELGSLQKGFRLLADFSQLERMDLECASVLGRMMDAIKRAGAASVVRVIPDPAKDIGMNILTVFHYRPRPQVTTCKTMTEAAEVMEL